MATSTSPTSELDALNLMLSVIGEAPLSSLADTQFSADAIIAKQVLDEVNRSTQNHGWHFNTDIKVKLTPAGAEGNLFLPANCLRVDTVAESAHIDVVQRGNRLFDRVKRTFTFTEPVYVDMVLLFDFSEIPQAARQYIAVSSARKFQERVVGSDILFQFSARDEQVAWRELVRAEGLNGDYNFLTSWSAQRVLQR